LSRPVEVLKLAQTGLFVIAYVSALPSASEADGVNEYAVPAVTLVAGVPLIVGALFDGSCTLIAKGGSESETRPSLTEITMSAKVPTLLVAGVPLKRPVDALKLAHAGLFEIAYVRGSLSASEADGVNA
jgi:hypothetical protein